jgi:hypothetical protein
MPRQKDLSFGDNRYQIMLQAGYDHVANATSNLSGMRYGIIPVAAPGMLNVRVLAINADEAVLFYAVSSARAACCRECGASWKLLRQPGRSHFCLVCPESHGYLACPALAGHSLGWPSPGRNSQNRSGITPGKTSCLCRCGTRPRRNGHAWPLPGQCHGRRSSHPHSHHGEAPATACPEHTIIAQHRAGMEDLHAIHIPGQAATSRPVA